MGEAIKANLDRLRRGQDSAVLPDPFDPERELLIELDPRLKPMDNAKRYFKKYRKLLDGLEAKRAQLARCREEAAGIAALLAEYERWLETAAAGAPVPPETAARAEELRIHVEGVREPQAEGDAPAERARARRFTSADGFAILVGKAAADNDHLTFRVAKGNDWWFHVAHYSGSHVVVRGTATGTLVPREHGGGNKASQFLPQETLLDAATLAAYFSKARGATRTEVHYTQAKHVRKRKGAPAGQVELAEHKCLALRLEEKRLARLLSGEPE